MTDFEKFFAGEFQQRLAAANIPDMTDASWDRRAAWLLYVAENRHVFKQTLPVQRDTADASRIYREISSAPSGVFD